MLPIDVVDFPFFDTKNGILTMIQSASVKAGKKLPFEIKRVLIMKGMKEGDVRGGHTHHKTRQIIFAISGGCTINLDNGKEKNSVRLDKFNQGVILESYTWHTMEKYDPDTILLVLADSEYDEADYIRNYKDFLKFVS